LSFIPQCAVYRKWLQLTVRHLRIKPGPQRSLTVLDWNERLRIPYSYGILSGWRLNGEEERGCFLDSINAGKSFHSDPCDLI
jgi:hypothetical protein